MNIAFYNGVSGMVAFQRNMDNISNNMANISTTGYKRNVTPFENLVYTTMNTKVEGDYLVGHGVKTDKTDVVFSQGTLNLTDRAMDFAIVGAGFFGVRQDDGTTAYTRNGAFSAGLVGNKAFLVSGDGQYILDAKGKNIEIPFYEGTNTLDTSGLREVLGVFEFKNPFGLLPKGGSNYLETAKSGTATAYSKESGTLGKNELLQSTLEFSNVDMAAEMIEVIQTQKAFSISSKIVQTSDQMEEIINNLR